MWSVKWCHFHWPWVTSKFLLPPHGNVVETLLDDVYIWKFTDISVCFPRSVCQKYRLYTSDTRARLGSAKASLATTTASLVFALICRQPAIDSPYHHVDESSSTSVTRACRGFTAAYVARIGSVEEFDAVVDRTGVTQSKSYVHFLIPLLAVCWPGAQSAWDNHARSCL